MKKPDPMEILLVEDSAFDVRLTRESLKDDRLPNRLHVVGDGDAALAFLRRQGDYAGMPRPDIVLLDLNLPRKNGREVLAEIKQDPALKTIPVIVLSTSGSEDDVRTSYNLHANAYLTKPVDLEKFMVLMRNLHNFWQMITKVRRSAPPPGGGN